MSATRGVAVLGATGSVGRSALEVVAAFPDRLRVTALAAGTRRAELAELARRFHPRLLAIGSRLDAEWLRGELPGVRVVHGPEGLVEAATLPEVDVVLAAVVGAAGLPSSYAAAAAGKTLALANKEALVIAGELVVAAARNSGAAILPVDSEHNALHQALRAGRTEEIETLWLTASGGPFLRTPLAELAGVTIEAALAHPIWRMGRKITIDSATMMNKGLEVIEAHFLFDVPGERIRVVIHPQGIVHSLVEFRDGSLIAELAVSDMKLPIQYALSYPERWTATVARLDPTQVGTLELAAVDDERFPAVRLAYHALAAGGSAPAVLNAANEVLVARFLEGGLRYPDIVSGVAAVLDRHTPAPLGGLGDALEWDAWGRREALSLSMEVF